MLTGDKMLMVNRISLGLLKKSECSMWVFSCSYIEIENLRTESFRQNNLGHKTLGYFFESLGGILPVPILIWPNGLNSEVPPVYQMKDSLFLSSGGKEGIWSTIHWIYGC